MQKAIALLLSKARLLFFLFSHLAHIYPLHLRWSVPIDLAPPHLLSSAPQLIMGGASDSNLLPPGFHFFPSDEELVVHFLRRKASLLPCQPDIVPTVCMNHHDPWELNGTYLSMCVCVSSDWFQASDLSIHSACHQHRYSLAIGFVRVVPGRFASNNNQQILFSPFLGKALEAGSQWYFFSHAKQSRATPNGYWSSVCADETVVSSGGCSVVGLKKTLVFSTGEPSDGAETNWIMHEYHLLDGRKGGSSSSSSTSSIHSSSKKSHHPNTVRSS